MNLAMDATARSALRDRCVAHLRQISMLHAGHQAATPEALDAAMRALVTDAEDARAAARSQRCRAELAVRLAADLAPVRAAPAPVAAEIDRLESRYGWLAADALGETAGAPARPTAAPPATAPSVPPDPPAPAPATP
jgi:hypothetical protein